MTHEFDRPYWEQHWQRAHGRQARRELEPNPHLVAEVTGLPPGTALDAGCGEGGEAIWLASQGWHVTAADISTEALARAADRARDQDVDVRWVRADLTEWQPETTFDLVATHYAHPTGSQLDFYERIARWVAPGGTLLVIGHTQGDHGYGHGDHGHGDGEPPASASVTAADVAARFSGPEWDVVTAAERERVVGVANRRQKVLRDVVVRATRAR